MKKVLALTVAFTLGAGMAYANFCAKDFVPGSTLLVPFAIVDADPATGDPDPAGYTTLLTVTNVSSTRQVIHVTLWNVLSEAVVDFSEILSGYDVWSINFRDLINADFGLFDTNDPSTGFFHPGTLGPDVDPYGPTRNRTNSSMTGNWPSLQGSQDIDFVDSSGNPTCPPHGPKIDPYKAAYLDIIRGGITDPLVAWKQLGRTSLGCLSGVELTDNGSWLTTLGPYPYIFYVTVDVVTTCTDVFPNQDAYWQGEFPQPNNVLIGQVFYFNFNSNFSESIPAVTIEGDLDWAAPGNTNIGFYEQLATAAGLDDFHEPLGSAYAINYFIDGGMSTDLIVWKEINDIVVTSSGDLFVDGCLGYTYYAWDEDEHFKAITTGGTISPPPGTPGEPNIFPFETQKVPVNANNFNALLGKNGWMLIVFDNTNGVANTSTNFYYPRAAQAYVAAQYNYGGYSTAIEAALLANTHCFATQTLNFFNTYTGAADNIYVR